jgi:LmbE family N-acetylglucosaminyl deacetylase
MITEDQIVPFLVSELPKGPWLIFAPHADDETLGLGGALLRAKQAGIETRLVVMTNGAMGGEQDNLVEVREQEAKNVAAFLGIAEVSFLGEADRQLKVSETLIDKVAEIIKTSKAAAVFFPAVLELHPDHRATAQLVWGALQKIADHALTAASYEISVQSPINCLLDVSAQMTGKLEALALYESQMEQNSYSDCVGALNRARSFTLPTDVNYAEGLYIYSPEERQQSLHAVFAAFTATLFQD